MQQDEPAQDGGGALRAEPWSCGHHFDTDPSFATVVQGATCPGDGKKRCSRPAVMVFVTLEEGGGALPPLTFTGACPKHRPRVGRLVARAKTGYLGAGEVPIREVPAVLAWFHGPSGLCAGDRGLSILVPQPIAGPGPA